jgi:hypothetical protein
MYRKYLRLAAAIPLLALAVFAAPLAPADAQGARGDTPQTAEDFGTRSVTKVGLLKSRDWHWMKASGGKVGTRMGATLQTNPWMDSRNTDLLQSGPQGAPDPGRIAVFVNAQGTGDDIMGQKNKDARGFTRLGFLTHTNTSGPDRVYHLVRWESDLGGTLFYLLRNDSMQDVVFAFSMDHSFCLGCTTRDGGAENPKTWGVLPPVWAFAG